MATDPKTAKRRDDPGLRGPIPGPDRVPPHNLDAERSLLGALLVSRDAVAEVTPYLEPKHFYRGVHAAVYTAMIELALVGEPVDAISVADKLPTDVSEAVGGVGGLFEFEARTPSVDAAENYAKIVRDNYTLRSLIGASAEIATMCYARPSEVSTAVDKSEQLIFDATQGRDRTHPETIGELLPGVIADIDRTSETSLTGLATGFADLDDLLGGLQPRSLYVVGARPAMGKTALGLNLLAHASVRMGQPVLLFSMEVGKPEVAARLLAAEARVDMQAMRRGKTRAMTSPAWDRIAGAVENLKNAPLMIDDNPYLNIMELRGRARRVKSRAGNLGLIAVDYLQLMDAVRRGENRQTEVSEISRGLKQLARELECPVVALSQLSRNLEARVDKRPMLADLRESGAIEQDADVVMFIYRDEVYAGTTDENSGIAELIIAKNRSGPMQTVNLVFHAQHATFLNAGVPRAVTESMDAAPSDW